MILCHIDVCTVSTDSKICAPAIEHRDDPGSADLLAATYAEIREGSQTVTIHLPYMARLQVVMP